MTALRKLAERWKAGRADDDALQNYVTGLADARENCADELLSILDAEGDGGAAGEAVAWVADLAPGIERPKEYTGIFTPHKEYAEHLAKHADYVITPLYTHPPAQAAQVSDEVKVDLIACDWQEGALFGVRDEPGEHNPCYLVLPSNELIPFVHHAVNGVDQARAQFIADCCNQVLSPIKQPIAGPAQTTQVDGIAKAAAYIQKKADDYAAENCSSEPDTGAPVYHFGHAGMDYHHTLIELAEEVAGLSPPTAEPVAQGEAVPFFYIDKHTAGAIANPMTPSRDGVRAYRPQFPLPDGEFVPVYLQAAQPRAVPDGWKLVPIEPTEAMCAAIEYGSASHICETRKSDRMYFLRKAIAAAPSPGESA